MRRLGGLVLLLAGCTPPSQPANNIAEPAVTNAVTEPALPPANTAAAADSLQQWLAGHWAYGDDCATDFSVVYQADGKLDAHGEVGSWAIAGNQVTETITERLGEAGEERVDPPETVRYTVERKDRDHAILRRGDRTQPIRRC